MRSNTELKGFGIDSLVLEHILVNKAHKMCHSLYRACGWMSPYMSSPWHTEMISLKRTTLFLNQKRRCHRRNRYS